MFFFVVHCSSVASRKIDRSFTLTRFPLECQMTKANLNYEENERRRHHMCWNHYLKIIRLLISQRVSAKNGEWGDVKCPELLLLLKTPFGAHTHKSHGCVDRHMVCLVSQKLTETIFSLLWKCSILSRAFFPLFCVSSETEEFLLNMHSLHLINNDFYSSSDCSLPFNHTLSS